MKKLLSLFVVAIIVMGTTTLHAQSINFGAKAGLNIAFFNTTADTDGTKPRIGYHIGAMLELGLIDKFAIQPEILYSTQGYAIGKQQEVPILGKVDIKSVTKFDYLNIPIMLKFFPIEGLSLEAGPQIGFLVNAKLKTSVNDETKTIDFEDVVKSIAVGTDAYKLNKFDYGVNFGLGYKISSLSLGIRYNLGLADIMKRPDLDKDSSKNGNFQISVGYFF